MNGEDGDPYAKQATVLLAKPNHRVPDDVVKQGLVPLRQARTSYILQMALVSSPPGTLSPLGNGSLCALHEVSPMDQKDTLSDAELMPVFSRKCHCGFAAP